MEELAKQGVLDRIRKNVPGQQIDDVIRRTLGREVAEEVAKQGIKKGCKRSTIKAIAKGLLGKLPVLTAGMIVYGIATKGYAETAKDIMMAEMVGQVAEVAANRLREMAAELHRQSIMDQLHRRGLTDKTIEELDLFNQTLDDWWNIEEDDG